MSAELRNLTAQLSSSIGDDTRLQYLQQSNDELKKKVRTYHTHFSDLALLVDGGKGCAWCLCLDIAINIRKNDDVQVDELTEQLHSKSAETPDATLGSRKQLHVTIVFAFA
jgi:hypothetical protein